MSTTSIEWAASMTAIEFSGVGCAVIQFSQVPVVELQVSLDFVWPSRETSNDCQVQLW